ncbi:MerR family transcriptional regulator [Candidatus Tenderia electrophaga]|jgi:chaperone modulatory protein CbpM|uniref:MerR family transcriptional regulator n=1 Tax=Candidatus Tenderia electrophaga TaxID=1748243 RepID=A0A0S2TDD2_9GAMM|nr:MerR family transcriptional regulator [Candidatus Tenderia electrophaga]
MNNRDLMEVLAGEILEEEMRLTLTQLSRACEVRNEWLLELVREGVIEPEETAAREWIFAGASLRRARVALRLQRDLGVNLCGAALALQLMDELETLRARLEAVERHD